jgi:RNA 3'-terminal phosphate cyclase (ATP)
MIRIDGSLGEGGGQILRTALSLSLITGKEFLIEDIRARRSKPGLRPQHLKSVEAAKLIGKADVEGDSLGSLSLKFSPKGIFPGRFKFDIATAGSTSLVFQTIYLPLSFASVSSSISITGGTHVPWSPSFEYLNAHWINFLTQMGFKIDLKLDQAGFYPEGHGRIQAIVKPVNTISPLNLTDRGQLIQIRGISAVANLDRRIAERQRNRVIKRLGEHYFLNDIRITQLPSKFKGTFLLLIAEFENTQACYFSLGKLGKPAEQVADEVVDNIESFLSSQATVDQFLADQLILPLSFARGVSQFLTPVITNHIITNVSIIATFLPVKINIEGNTGVPGLVVVNPAHF